VAIEPIQVLQGYDDDLHVCITVSGRLFFSILSDVYDVFYREANININILDF
jgi:hypothetical protein